jgi:hypothetical protein
LRKTRYLASVISMYFAIEIPLRVTMVDFKLIDSSSMEFANSHH